MKSHAKCHKEDSRQQKFRVENQTAVLQKRIELSLENQVVKAKILQTLHFAENNYSFSSAATDSERFQIMFLDSQIAKSFSQGKTKISYNVDYGIAPYLNPNLLNVFFSWTYSTLERSTPPKL